MNSNSGKIISGLFFTFILIASTFKVSSLNATAASEIIVDDFEGFDAPTPWTFTSGDEFPGASGSLTLGSGHTGNGAHLAYNIGEGGHYVSAELDLPQPLPASMVAFWVKSPPGIYVKLRVVDETLQTLQYNMRRPLYATDPSSWYHQAVDLALPVEYWGGAGDGILHGNLQHISILAADPLESTAVGAIEFDDVKIMDQILVDLNPFENPVISAPQESADLIPLLGVNIHFTQDDTALDAAKSAGFTWIRMDLLWCDIESVPGSYNFSAYDQLLADLEARNMRALFVLSYGNPLYTGGWDLPPTTPAAVDAFGNFAEATARHYAGRGVKYEIWNEPDISRFWPPLPDASQYAALASEASSHVHIGDPVAKVTTAGLAGINFSYLRRYLTHAGGLSADAIGIHPYRNDVPEIITDDVVLWRSIVTQALPTNLPSWDTEWGYSSTAFGNGHSLEARRQHATMVTRELLTAWSLGFPLIIYYDIRDDGLDPYDAEHNFGLLALDYSDKPAMQAVRTLTSVARERRFVGYLPIEPTNIHALKLEGSSDDVVILWADAGEATVSVPSGTMAENLFGEDLPLNPIGDQLSLVVKEPDGPMYLFFPKRTIYLPIINLH